MGDQPLGRRSNRARCMARRDDPLLAEACEKYEESQNAFRNSPAHFEKSTGRQRWHVKNGKMDFEKRRARSLLTRIFLARKQEVWRKKKRF